MKKVFTFAHTYSIEKQKYEHTDITEGVFYLKNKATGKHLTLNGTTKVTSQNSFSGNEYQKWYLESVAYQRGDINCSGAFDSNDQTLALQYASHTVTLSDLQIYLADVNGDDVINAKDALAINKLIP